MKIYRLIPLLLLAAVSILTGCENDADNIEPFDVSSKLAVISYISPLDTVVQVQLQKTQPAIGKELSDEQLKVTNATVTISDGTNVTVLYYNPDADVYRTAPYQLQILAGKTYFLTITTPDGFSAKASCTVPDISGINITDVIFDYTLEPDYSGGETRRYKVAVKWTDAPDVKNYYRIMGTREFTALGYYGEEQIQTEPLYQERDYSYLYKDEKMQSGTIISDELYYYRHKNYDLGKKYKVNLFLLVTDRNYYLFQDALHRQQQFDGNPFAEPVILYSNIEGGVGVFTGYNQVKEVREME